MPWHILLALLWLATMAVSLRLRDYAHAAGCVLVGLLCLLLGPAAGAAGGVVLIGWTALRGRRRRRKLNLQIQADFRDMEESLRRVDESMRGLDELKDRFRP
jgi:hypothetical protein